MNVLEDFKKLMSLLEFENKKAFDDDYYWYGEKKLYYKGELLPSPMEFHITIKSIPNNIDDTIISTKIIVPTNQGSYDMPIDKCILFLKEHFKYELRKTKVDTLLNE